MDPPAPSQPSLDTAYTQPSNPAQSSTEHASSTTAAASAQRSAPTASTRREGDVDSDQNPGVSALAYGERDARNDAGDSMGSSVSNTEGEQLRAAGDGDIARAQDSKDGFGEQTSLTKDLDRKKAEQGAIKEGMAGSGDGMSGGGVDVGGVLGGKGGSGFVGAGGEGDEGGAGGGAGGSFACVMGDWGVFLSVGG
ncbi:MAG: hypothetical protein OHK93_002498 [Ramalina farinacea]|uniref:Uncharacterized protein n=1 Tax=Ramalina farinacea TaxID=258253 RepID=A0AA43QT99_9LECA|nr:hypothetical protein [Ramalina farinacea]